MTKPDTGGPAKDETLLDKRAGEAMQGMVQEFVGRPDDGRDIDTAFIGISKASYSQAEAMIAEKRRRENA